MARDYCGIDCGDPRPQAAYEDPHTVHGPRLDRENTSSFLLSLQTGCTPTTTCLPKPRTMPRVPLTSMLPKGVVNNQGACLPAMQKSRPSSSLMQGDLSDVGSFNCQQYAGPSIQVMPCQTDFGIVFPASLVREGHVQGTEGRRVVYAAWTC
jgi:hypothetical protein